MVEYQLWWPGEQGLGTGETLLLVAVDAAGGARPGLPENALPCRVLGTLAPGCPPFPDRRRQREETPSRAARLLTALGVPANLLGHAYLCTALALVTAHPEMKRGLMRTLYPEVAQRHGVTARSVERAIRHAIAQTWVRGGGEEYRRLLGRMGSIVADRPTNSEFIALLADYLLAERRGAQAL